MNEEERKQKILEEVIAAAQRQSSKKQPGEFSAREFSVMANVSREIAIKILGERVQSGKLKIRRTKRGDYYSIV